MKIRRKQTAWIVAGVCVTVLVGFLVWKMQRPPEVTVFEVKPQTIEVGLSVVGRARPGDLVQVASPNPGQVTQLFVDDGDVVTQGAALATIRATVEQAETEVEVARAAAARAEVAEARLNFSRTQTLYERGFAAKAALDSARATLQTAEANLAAANASVRASSERTREYTIRSPMNGVVLVRPIDNGQVVTVGETLFELGSNSGTEIQAEVEEAYADTLRPGMLARAAASGSEAIFTARVSEVSPRVNSATGARLIKLMPEGGSTLSPGRSIDLTVVVDTRQGAITIPRQAVIDATAAPKVRVVDADNTVRERPVTIERWPSTNAIITEGLKAGDRLVLDPAAVEVGKTIRPVAASGR